MAAEAWLASLTAHGLPGAAPLRELPTDVREVVHLASRHKLVGLLAAAVADGALELAPADAERVAHAHEGAMREALLLEEVLLEAVAVLSAAGLDHRVLKGTALAHMVYPDPAERCFGDNDLLIAPDEIDRAVDALVRAGAVRSTPPLSSSYDRRFAKSVTLRWRDSTELDIHRTLAPGPYGFLIDLTDLARDPVEVLLAGRAVRTLPADLHLLHGAIHVALGDVEPRLGNVRDLALLSRQPSLDVEKIIETAHRWGCVAPVAVGLAATGILGHHLSPIEQWAASFEIGAKDHRLLALSSQRDGRFRRQALASWRVLGWRDRIAFSRSLVAPTAANRAARGRSLLDHVRGLRPR